jgi:hypothetical protein
LKPVFISHPSYQEYVLSAAEVLRSACRHYRECGLAAHLQMSDYRFSPVTELLAETYSPKGPEPRDPASMLRSYHLFLLCKQEIGITEWVKEMYRGD